MGHDISGYNKAGEEIAYARFSMGNYNSVILYTLLDAHDYFGGVSGTGRSSTFSVQQMVKAFDEYNKKYSNYDTSPDKIAHWDLKQISEFINNCLETAQIEGSVRVYFG